MPVSISVSGTSNLYRSPERATLHLEVSKRGPEKEQVSSTVTGTSNQILSMVKDLAPPKKQEASPSSSSFSSAFTQGTGKEPITWWSLGSTRTYSYHEWNEKTQRSDIQVHSASTRIKVKFRDFEKMGEMVSLFSTLPDVEVAHVEWDLTDKTRESLQEETRQSAVREAMTKAKHYAGALGLSVLDCLEINDPEAASVGSGSVVGYGVAQPRMMRMAASAPAGGDGGLQGLEMSPEDIEITTIVHAKFIAS
ncbi:hypothetical protein IE53DRAFT_384833 [Violaceomyces palustris]|uniref:Uncharacterized protein n=1 Tax=Violaceomyces palustris TaxID=1673888 RepID=A0ACD0P3W1_9BASI|nr:hypothetical protein IE53DRAFT_384833 [Violaceomyces palustris]